MNHCSARRLLKFRRGAVRGSPSPPYIWIAIAVIAFLALFQWYQQHQEDQLAAEKDKEAAAAKAEKTASKKTPAAKQEPAEDDKPSAPPNKPSHKKPVTLEPSVTAADKSSAPKNTTTKLPAPAEKSDAGNPNAGKYLVTHIADGDTFNLKGSHRVRLIGIDCPEIAHPDKDPPTRAQPWSAEAMAFTKARLNGQTVRIEFDPEYDAEDHYGRWLCWVYYRDRDGVEKLLNEELLRQGLAYAYDDRRKFHYTEAMYRRLKAAQREAQDEERGIYSK